nr:patatin-like phospholipase family protein [Mesorhizobium sp.]
MPDSSPSTWEEKLRPGLSSSSTFDGSFFQQHGHRPWAPNEADHRAALSLHVELISRVATQKLDYSQGVEEAALTSIFELFAKTRSFCAANVGCSTFEIVTWHALNGSVRPFTSRWHSISQSGGLRALDTSDEFRAELEIVQRALLDLDRALQLIAGHDGYSAPQESNPQHAAVDNEMRLSPVWRPMGLSEVDELASQEKELVLVRRRQYEIDQERRWASGIALSGGGIRSATFAIGVLAALARRNLLPQFDYISSVSGGGFTAGFLTQLLGGPDNDPHFGLDANKQPFVRDDGESLILRKVRQSASYLSGSFLECLALGTIQAHGIFINLLVITLLIAIFAYGDFAVSVFIPGSLTDILSAFLSIAAVCGILIIPLASKTFYRDNKPSFLMSFFGLLFLLPPAVFVLHLFHAGVRYLTGLFVVGIQTTVSYAPVTLGAILTWLALTVSGFVAAGAIVSQFNRLRPAFLTAFLVLFLLMTESLFYTFFVDGGQSTGIISAGLAAVTLFFLWRFLDINVASLHHYYRAKLSDAFLLRPSGEVADPINLSTFDGRRALFPIINCALNVPNSKNPVMRGRLSDVFAITPVAAGAGVLGYIETSSWEKSNTNLDLGSTIALSGAAVSPQMGLRTKRYASFWLTALNLRLGIWLRRPGITSRGPGLWHLVKEMTATADEHGAFLNISDGGHIENLGVYELLKRRCRFVVAIDGENDPTMTFHALTNLQRLAYIDFGIVLDINLDDLRLGEAGYSRSHFQLCRIFYPQSPDQALQEIGYLLYMKLSLTGNEGEYLRRYKLDEPAFPHHSTADQFFSETQFEAYRSLGEHVGEKMFLPAITGPLSRKDVQLEEWFRCLGHSLLRPMPSSQGAQ